MKFFLLLLFTGYVSDSFGQDKNQFYAMDADMNQTVLDSSKYILWIHLKEDSNWQWDYYRTWGPLVKSVSYADHDGTTLNGRSSFYNSLGNIDSTGNFERGKRSGYFYKFSSYTADSIRRIKTYKYVRDSLVKSIDLLADSNKKIQTDSSKRIFAEYPGGVSQWYIYLKQKLQYPDRALKKNIQGTVRIYFTVGEEGNIQDVFLQKSVEYSIDQEAIRIIYNSGTWIPATKDGVKVKNYKLEPIRFGLDAR